MKNPITALVALAALALCAAPASAAGIKYKGKTSSGHPITFELKKNRLYNMRSGIRISCLPIKGGGQPSAGAETFSYKGYAAMRAKGVDFTFMKKPAFYYNEVTTKHTLLPGHRRVQGQAHQGTRLTLRPARAATDRR